MSDNTAANRPPDLRPWSAALLLALAAGCAQSPQRAAAQPAAGAVGALSIDAGDNSLSYEGFVSVTNGWGPLERDRSNGEQADGDGRPLTLGGVTFARGFGVHAGSSVTLDVGGRCDRFTATVGVDDEVGDRGSVVFQVYGDGQKLYESPVLRGPDAGRPVDVPIAGKRQLRLVVTDAGDGIAYDHADWADPMARACAASTSSAPPPPSSPPSAPSVLSWSNAPSAPINRFEAQGAAVNGRLYVLGGFDRMPSTDYIPRVTARSDALDPATGTWERLADMPEAVTHAGTAVDGGVVWLAGGFVGDHPGPQTNHVWKYDTVRNTWSRGPDLPAARGGGALARVGRQLHFFGGTVRSGFSYLYDSGDHWVLDLDGGTSWRAAASLPNPRNHLAAVTVGGLIYAVGGQHLGDEHGGNLADVHAYDPTTNTWTPRAALPLPLGHTSTSTLVQDGRILVIGGVTTGQKKTSTVLRYDPASNAWTSLTALPAARQSPIADLVNGRLVVTSGSNDAGPTNTTWIGSW
ncbi:NPCBM/NEW2 domain-containing protein [Deinococcus pimensis]|uniref:NPCBM/NEW2 domain-containing protein n=1 Tax=Deinococcus pimensis TaxID=309888 RepID=UPI0004ACD941|nr:NPCBM/NEW2 domain-containing protein [Deinococcus pimensis]